MLKMGLPRMAVAAKMQQEGKDPSILDKSPDDLMPLEEGGGVGGAGGADGEKGPSSLFGGLLAKKSKGPVVRKKKLHWKALDASKVGQDSLWADKDDEIGIKIDDEAEFNQLFVERCMLLCFCSYDVFYF